MPRRLTLALVALLAAAAPVQSQILKLPRSREPIAWGSAAVGYQQSQTVNDGSRTAAWQFSGGVQYRASLEKGISNASSIGVTGTLARMPLRYYDLLSCSGNGCDAHATVWSAAVSFHAGGGVGFHQVIDASAGVTMFDNFTADDDGRRIGPPKGDPDPSLSIGFGFGYNTSQRLEIAIVQDALLTFHQRKGLSGNESSTANHYTTRLGVRYGLGQRTRVR